MLEDLTLFAMAQKSLNYLARRQEVLAENVANADTPKYRAKDLEPLSFKDVLTPPDAPIRAVTTNPMHISPQVEPTAFQVLKERNPVESKPDGNSVQVEDQMQKIGDTKGKYDLAINLFMKHLSMLRTAIDKGGV
ncbi:MAG TPA: flagellar basal body rod protein FlgB [Rhodospirillaceae bacterium]|nr:flagellar basal body rod protein FlgB [Rhodospirillaceae bacterium]